MSLQTVNSVKIPIQNMWLLMLYAHDLIHTLPRRKRIAVEKNPEGLANLIAEILTFEVKTRLRRNLSVDLERRYADLSRVRGRINHIRTARRSLLQRGKVACSFDVFTVDTSKNQLVKAALNRLATMVTGIKLKQRCRANVSALERSGVITEYSHSWLLDKAKTHRIITSSQIVPEDRIMLAAAELALDLELPTEQSGNVDWITPERDAGNMRILFEKAISNFYKIRLREKWNIGSRIMTWKYAAPTEQIDTMLPRMKTDITLDRLDTSSRSESRIIIDTKYNNIITTNRYGKEQFRSNYLYQIYAYLRSQEDDEDMQSYKSTGMLLHPSVGVDFDESVIIQGHKIRFVTVDLSVDSTNILKRLLDIIPY